VYLFGGALRDLMVAGPSAVPRDVDLVIAGAQSKALEDALAVHVKRRTRFGGLHLGVDDWMIDIWPLRETWAFREQHVETGFSMLPRTTFLNVEAVAVELAPRRGRRRVVYAHGFFEGVLDGVVEINFEENPFPTLCVVRGLITAARLQFRLGPRLARYVLHYSGLSSIEELVDVQRSHYGYVRASPDELHTWLAAVSDQVSSRPCGPVSLPVSRSRQLEFWTDPASSR
jgi:hypothetical protein